MRDQFQDSPCLSSIDEPSQERGGEEGSISKEEEQEDLEIKHPKNSQSQLQSSEISQSGITVHGSGRLIDLNSEMSDCEGDGIEASQSTSTIIIIQCLFVFLKPVPNYMFSNQEMIKISSGFIVITTRICGL